MNENRWWQNGVIYQIYPRSFYDTNHDGIGDIPGIIAKLDYLHDLGVDALWLSPVYPSPQVDFGYDVSDYTDIDAKFGTLEDFKTLLAQAHQRGIRIILDLVLNHTSDRHPWFRESRSSRDNPKRDWYLWRDPAPGGSPPNNWASWFGGSGWEWDASTGQYYFHMFYKEQPDLNWRNPQVVEEIRRIFRFWCDLGMDGFRLDVFNVYLKHADLPANPPKPGLRTFDRQVHLHDINQPELVPALQEIRSILDEYPGRFAVGETFLDPEGRTENYVGEDKLHAVFNFRLANSPWKTRRILDAVLQWQNELPVHALPTWVLNNHDLPRAATRFGRRENDQRLKQAAALLLTLRGTSFLYYGEEIGMRDIPVGRSEIKDRVGRRYWPLFKGRDGCRSPMQWDAGRNAGFSTDEPWLPVHANYPLRNAARQAEEPTSLLNFYKALIRLRRQHSSIQHGLFLPLNPRPFSILAYLRQTDEETILVALNFSRRSLKLTLGERLAASRWQVLLSSHANSDELPPARSIALHAEETLILKLIKR